MFIDDIMSAFTQAERTSSEVNYDMACLESEIAVVSCQDFWQTLQLPIFPYTICTSPTPRIQLEIDTIGGSSTKNSGDIVTNYIFPA